MIAWHEKIKKSQNVINAVVNQLLKENINTDGVAEIFNNGKEQGVVLKIYDKYNPYLDLCIWSYLPSNRDTNNCMNVIIGKRFNCNNLNMWEGNDLEKVTFSEKQTIEMHKKARDFIVDTVVKNFEKTRDISKI